MTERKLTKKEAENLAAWKRWGLMMKMLKAIHREIEPKKQMLHDALNQKDYYYYGKEEEPRPGTNMYHFWSIQEDIAQLLE